MGELKTKKSKEIKQRYRYLISCLRDINIKMDFIFLERPNLNILSATKFIKAIKHYRKKQRKLTEYEYKKLRFFIPEKLSDKAVKYIVNELFKCNLI